MLENIKNSIVTDADLLFVIQREIDMIKGFCQAEQPEAIPPILQVLDSSEQQQLIPLFDEQDFNKSQERRHILMKVGAAFYQYWGREIFPAIVILTSEAWMKSFQQNAVPDKIRQPSDYPDAIDSVVVQAVTLTKSSTSEAEGNPRAAMAVLEIKQRKPYLQVEDLIEPNITTATRDSTDLLNHFYMGWFQQSLVEQN